MKEELLASIPPYQREARTKGVPQLGSGAIYPVPEDDITTPDFPIPDFWPRGFALDVGWNRTAAIWVAKNPDAGIYYIYSEMYRAHAEPSVNVDSIRARGNWIPGVIDPASRGRSQKDGRQLLQDYKDLGLDIETALNTVESGIYQTWQLLSAGKLKVFKNACPHWLTEFRIYQRDEDGNIVKENDHLMDATRYFVLSGRDRMKQRPANDGKKYSYQYSGNNPSTSWMN